MLIHWINNAKLKLFIFSQCEQLVFYFKSLAELKQLFWSADLQLPESLVWSYCYCLTSYKLKDTLISSTKVKLFIGLFNKEDILLVYVS